MPKFAIQINEKNPDGVLIPKEGLTQVFLQPQPDQSSSNPPSMSPDSLSVTLTESGTSPGLYTAEITNPYPRYDLYVSGAKRDDFSGTKGFFFPANKMIYTKRGISVASTADTTPDTFTTGSGQLANPDGGGTWPKFDTDNLPVVFVLEPSEVSGGLYVYRKIALVKNTVAVNGSNNLTFQLSLDPNGPTLGAYTCDLMIVMP